MQSQLNVCLYYWTSLSIVPIISRGGSFLVGEVILDPNGDYKHHGDVVFLYPDLSTAIRGQFIQGRLTRGHEARVTAVTWSRGLPSPVTSHVSGAGAVFSYQPSGSLCISKSPMLRDPYETRQVYVAQSRIRLVKQSNKIIDPLSIYPTAAVTRARACSPRLTSPGAPWWRCSMA